MMLPSRFVLTLVAFCLVVCSVQAQEAPSAKAGDTPPPGVDKKYFDLTKSKDAKVKGLAERYLNLVKLQEWSTASGKAIIARYVSHDPDLKHVKLSVPKGNGKDRVFTEYNVEVEKQLSKSGQARVKQIDTIQKRLDEMAATAKPGDVAGTPAGPEGAERPARGKRAAREEKAAAPEASPPPQAAAQPDPSESEPDPLGFAELPPVAAGPVPGPGH